MSPIQPARPHRAVLVSLPLAIGLALPLAAQTMSEKAVEAEIDFARGLARDWAFVDMAQSVLEEVGRADLSDRMQAELELVRCDIYGIGAKASTDPERRNDLFEQAISAYDDYISANPYSENTVDAKASLVELADVYARSIDISLEDAAGEEADALRERKIAVLENAVRISEGLIEELEQISEPTAAQTTQRYVHMLNKAGLYAKMSATTDGDAFFGEQAIDTFSNLVFEVGPGTEIALRANAGIGDVYAARGEDDVARDFYLHVINSVIPTDPEQREEALGWSDMPLDIKQKRFLYVELVIPGVQQTSRRLGELEAAIDAGLFFYNLYRQEGFSLSVLGNEAVLEFAKTLVDAGGFIGGDLGAGEAQWFPTEEAMRDEVRARRLQRSAIEFALDLAKQIVGDNPGTEAARKGGELIASINERPGVEIPPAQLLQAADAKYASQDYEAALAGYRELLTRLDALEPASRVEFGAKTYYGLGLTLGRQERDLQSAMAFREALLNWRDPEFDGDNARGYLAKIRSWARDSGAMEDPEVADLVTEAENFVIDFGSEDVNPDEIIYNRGEKLRTDEDYDAAIATYEKIEPDAGFYELAQIQIGISKLYKKDLLGAREVFDSYLTERVTDPEFAPTSPIEEARRQGAMARAAFYRAYIDHVIARTRFEKSEGEDASGYLQVVDQLKDYSSEHRGNKNLVRSALALLADSYAKSGQAAKAAQAVDEMIQDFPDDAQTASAAIDLYIALRDRRARLEEDEEPDAAAITQLTRDMANALEVANEISPRPNYTRLRNESLLWLELGEWEEAKRPLESLVQRFGDDPERSEGVTVQVVPDLAEVLIELGDVLAAKELLSPLVIGDDAPLRFRRPTILLSRAMLGTVVGEGTRVRSTPGAGGTDEEFDFITKRLDTFATSSDQWSCEWYEAKFQSIYAYYVWGQQDDRKLATARTVIDDIVNLLEGDRQFLDVDVRCSSEDIDPDLRRRLGDGVLASRFRWLYQQTR